MNLVKELERIEAAINKIGVPKNEAEKRELQLLEHSYAMYNNQLVFANKKFYSLKHKS